MTKKHNQEQARRPQYISEAERAQDPTGDLNTGFYNTNLSGENYAVLDKNENEVADEHNGTLILKGKDSKYGSEGDTHAAEITIVAGPAQQAPVTHTFADDDGPSTVYTRPTGVGPPFVSKNPPGTDPAPYCSDGAAISVSQKSDWNEKTGVRKHESRPESKGKSGIALSGDAVFIKANETLSLSTNPHGFNSRGGRIPSVPGIDLIAGGNAAALQPMVKGDNLRACVNDICNQVRDLNSIVYGFLLEQMRLNEVFGNHWHPPPVLYEYVQKLSRNEAEAHSTNATLLALSIESLENQLTNLDDLEKNYITGVGDGYIASRLNKTN